MSGTGDPRPSIGDTGARSPEVRGGMTTLSRCGARGGARPARAPGRPSRCCWWPLFTITTLPGVPVGRHVRHRVRRLAAGHGYVVIARVALVRPLSSAVNRRCGGWSAAGVALRGLGFVRLLGYVRLQEPRRTPRSRTAAGSLWTASSCWRCGCCCGTRIREALGRYRARRPSVGLTVAGVAVPAAVRTPSTRSPSGPARQRWSSPTSPTRSLDIGMLVLVTGALVGIGFRSWSTLTAGARHRRGTRSSTRCSSTR